MEKLLAQAGEIVGTISPGAEFQPYGSFSTPGKGLALFLSNILRLVFIVAGVFAFLNLIVAGFQYMTAAGDSKALNAAWARIWQSLLGLVIIVGSFALAALFGKLIFNDPGFMLNPKIYGPN